MYRFGVITDPETATGFRLAGVEVHEAATPQEALEHLRQFVALDYGLVAINEALLQGTADERARLLRGRDLPIIVPFPAPEAEVESAEQYVARLVKEHIGFYVKLR
ncbi:MAG: V-type ATP synthase subunit F [Armatimonadota bacterium]|nr:V-type ATP synthase subunit F [Armatimonadota bacterium]MDR7534248.1 V-type ATP synthase subunit F [Armatimonadota bacterium]MDR7535802.1 V-type ATP synthase subunit F [Armatimonadota bacterium]